MAEFRMPAGSRLRAATKKVGKSGARGVYLGKDGMYVAKCHWKGYPHHVGTFHTLELAVAARNAWMVEHGCAIVEPCELRRKCNPGGTGGGDVH